MKWFISSLLGLGSFLIVSGADWSYEGKSGPRNWPNHYPGCGGYYQSPINIDGGIYTRLQSPLWLDYDLVPETMMINNIGHVVVLSGNGTRPRIQLGRDWIYQLDSVHFHWGKDNSEGSEHMIKGRRYPLEMHAIHKRVQSNAVRDPSEILVVAILFKISHQQENLGLEKFVNIMPIVSFAETATDIEPFPWSALIPQFESDFYVYQGSLTTPPCSEGVNFFIRGQIDTLSERQMEIFRELQNDEGEELSGNFRPLQPLNGRNVYYIIP